MSDHAPGDLRDRSPGYYAPSEAERAAAWSGALFAVDANVLLGLYRYSTSTRDELISALDQIGDRLWLPHQAAIEFDRQRVNELLAQIEVYQALNQAIRDQCGKLRKTFDDRVYRHPVIEVSSLREIADKLEAELLAYLEDRKGAHPLQASNAADIFGDPTRARIEELFRGRVGAPYLAEEHAEAAAEARRRIAEEIPPGYLDGGKPDAARQIGDYLFWKQACDRAVQVACPLVILTDDAKDDWWWRAGGLTLGPRPELVEEFYQRSGQPLLMYSSARFLTFVKEQEGGPVGVSQKAVDEVRLVNEARAPRVEQVVCPYCDSTTRVRIAPGPGSAATPVCNVCEGRFHAFRRGDESVGVRRPGERAERLGKSVISCPDCGDTFSMSVPFSGETTVRGCFNCGALMTVDSDGRVYSDGASVRVSAPTGATACPRCDTSIYFNYYSEPLRAQLAWCSGCNAIVSRPTLAGT